MSGITGGSDPNITTTWGQFIPPGETTANADENLWYKTVVIKNADGTDQVTSSLYEPSVPGLPPPSGDVSADGLVYISQTQQTYRGELPDAEQIQADVQTALTTLTSQTISNPDVLSLSAASGLSPFEVFLQLQTTANTAVATALSSLSPEDQAAIQCALAFPDTASQLTSAQQLELATVQTAINTAVQTNAQTLGGDSYTPPDSLKIIQPDYTTTRSAITSTFNTTFRGLIANTTGLQPGDNLLLLGAFYSGSMNIVTNPSNPETDTRLTTILQTLRTQMQTALAPSYGALVNPSSPWTPFADPSESDSTGSGYSSSYLEVLNGAFLYNFQNALSNQTPPLTEEQQANIALWGDSYLSNPNDADIPAHFKTLMSGLITQATNATITAYGLVSTWAPSLSNLTAAVSPTGNMLFNASTLATDMLDEMKSMISAMPASAGNAGYLNYLKMIGAAIDQIKETIFSLQKAQIEESSKMNDLQHILNQLQVTMTEAAQVAADAAAAAAAGDAKSKMSGLALFTTILKDIFVVAVGILFAPVTGGLSLAAGIAATIPSGSSGATQMDALASDIQNACGGPNSAGGQIALFIFTTVTACANPMVGFNLFFGKSGCAYNMFKDFGCSDTQAQFATAISGAVVELIAIIVMTVVACIFTGGAAAAPMIMMIAGAIGAIMAITTSSLQIVQATEQIKLDNLAAEQTLIAAEENASVADTQATIDALTKVLNRLLADISSNTGMLTSNSKLQGSILTDASQLLSAIRAAGHA